MTDEGRPLRPTDLKRLHRRWRRRTDQRLAVALDQVQNPFNLGSIARVAAAYGAAEGWAAGAGSGLRHPKVQKTALGTDRLVAWAHGDDVAVALAEARARGYLVVGIELTERATPIFELDLAGDVCLVLGHEERGLSARAIAACDRIAYLPLVGKVGSLNVAAAAAAACYEVRRQGWSSGSAAEA